MLSLFDIKCVAKILKSIDNLKIQLPTTILKRDFFLYKNNIEGEYIEDIHIFC